MRSGAASLLILLLVACEGIESSDTKQQQQQETILSEATAQVGMPAIKNFRERKLMKDILEMRDQEGLVTYTYVFSEMTGKLTFFCDSIGYGLPYATQFTNPQKIVTGYYHSTYVTEVIAQADPNGLFSPSSAEGTWIMCKDPHGKDVRPVYVEPRTIVSPFKLEEPPSQEIPVTVTASPSSKAGHDYSKNDRETRRP